jgi:hypothetical protein
MAREPSYPEDAAVGAQPEDAEATGKAGESKRTKHIVTGAAIGIGSAALVAALLYANRSRGKPGKKND